MLGSKNIIATYLFAFDCSSREKSILLNLCKCRMRFVNSKIAIASVSERVSISRRERPSRGIKKGYNH